MRWLGCWIATALLLVPRVPGAAEEPAPALPPGMIAIAAIAQPAAAIRDLDATLAGAGLSPWWASAPWRRGLTVLAAAAPEGPWRVLLLSVPHHALPGLVLLLPHAAQARVVPALQAGLPLADMRVGPRGIMVACATDDDTLAAAAAVLAAGPLPVARVLDPEAELTLEADCAEAWLSLGSALRDQEQSAVAALGRLPRPAGAPDLLPIARALLGASVALAQDVQRVSLAVRCAPEGLHLHLLLEAQPGSVLAQALRPPPPGLRPPRLAATPPAPEVLGVEAALDPATAPLLLAAILGRSQVLVGAAVDPALPTALTAAATGLRGDVVLRASLQGWLCCQGLLPGTEPGAVTAAVLAPWRAGQPLARAAADLGWPCRVAAGAPARPLAPLPLLAVGAEATQAAGWMAVDGPWLLTGSDPAAVTAARPAPSGARDDAIPAAAPAVVVRLDPLALLAALASTTWRTLPLPPRGAWLDQRAIPAAPSAWTLAVRVPTPGTAALAAVVAAAPVARLVAGLRPPAPPQTPAPARAP